MKQAPIPENGILKAASRILTQEMECIDRQSLDYRPYWEVDE